jgi:predicted short-subunit dehydrogenase-like oxidoreductase (DUF2520 family)
MLRGMAKSKPSITLVGAGSLAQVLIRLLPAAGYKIDEIVIRPKSEHKTIGAKLAREVGARLTTPKEANWRAGIVWLAVNDGAISAVAKSLAPLADWKSKIALHSSGALSSDELAPLKRGGANVASAHPMMTFVPGRMPGMSGVAWTLEGDKKATSTVREIVRKLGGLSIAIDRRQKALYHAFGAFLSPLLIVHLETASQLARASRIRRRELAAVMRPIVQQTLLNFFENLSEKGGSGKAFSGPLKRGDVETINRHLGALKGNRAALELYVALVSGALQSGLPIKNGAAIRRAISKK